MGGNIVLLLGPYTTVLMGLCDDLYLSEFLKHFGCRFFYAFHYKNSQAEKAFDLFKPHDNSSRMDENSSKKVWGNQAELLLDNWSNFGRLVFRVVLPSTVNLISIRTWLRKKRPQRTITGEQKQWLQYHVYRLNCWRAQSKNWLKLVSHVGSKEFGFGIVNFLRPAKFLTRD